MMMITNIQVDDQVQYTNILGEQRLGVVLKINKDTYRIIDTNNLKILSIKKERVKKAS